MEIRASPARQRVFDSQALVSGKKKIDLDTVYIVSRYILFYQKQVPVFWMSNFNIFIYGPVMASWTKIWLNMKSDWLWERGAVILISVSVLYWKLTRSLSKSYPVVCLCTRFLLVARNCSFEAFYSFTAHSTFCWHVPIFHSSWEERMFIYSYLCGGWKYLFTVGCSWLYSILLSAGMASYVHRMHYVGWMVYGV